MSYETGKSPTLKRMPSVGQIVAFSIAAGILIAIPGPSVVFAVGRALAHGRTVALTSVLGNSLGALFVLALVCVGLGALVAESAPLFWALKTAGCVYLIYLGIEAIRKRRAFGSTSVDPAEPVLHWRTSLRQGFFVGASNPKSLLLATAVVPQFVDRDAADAQLQFLVLGLVFFAIALLSDGVWVILAARLRTWFSRSPRREGTVSVAGGLSMIGLGVSVAFADGHIKSSS